MSHQLSEAKTSITRAAHRIFAEMACDAAFIVQPDGAIEYANDGAKELLGVGSDIHGQNLFTYLVEDCAEAVREALLLALQSTPTDLEVQLRTADGDVVHVLASVFWDVGTNSLWVVGPDLSQQRAREAHLRQLAQQDSLTGLPNRMVLNERLEWHIKDSKRRNARFAAVALDLDGFKRVNDALGHLAGDALLQVVASRITSSVRDFDTVSRTGGDEFFLVIPDMSGYDSTLALCNRVVDAIRRPVMVGGQEAYVSASVGVAMFPEHGTEAAELVQHADLAMYQSKHQGKNRITAFMPELKSNTSAQISLEAAMHSALREGEFTVFYQPVVDTNGVIRGCEALMRWHRPDGTWISPADFIPVAESTGLITLLGDYVLRAATTQLRRFDDAGLAGLVMSVNVSPRQLRNPSFENNLVRALKLSGIAPNRLILEITENMLMSSQEQTQALLRKIAAHGVRFSIDDFGTGYSCLAYLKTYPISVLKIDRSFVIDIATDPTSRAIAKAVIDLSSALKVRTVAEGVETEAQADVLRELGAGYIQGYIHGRPTTPEELIQRFGTPVAA